MAKSFSWLELLPWRYETIHYDTKQGDKPLIPYRDAVRQVTLDITSMLMLLYTVSLCKIGLEIIWNTE